MPSFHSLEGWEVGFQPYAMWGHTIRVCGGAHVVECIHFNGRGHWCVQFSPVLTAIAALPSFCPSLPWLLLWEKLNMVGVAVQGAPIVTLLCKVLSK
jgi:hypothetical protein